MDEIDDAHVRARLGLDREVVSDVGARPVTRDGEGAGVRPREGDARKDGEHAVHEDELAGPLTRDDDPVVRPRHRHAVGRAAEPEVPLDAVTEVRLVETRHRVARLIGGEDVAAGEGERAGIAADGALVGQRADVPGVEAEPRDRARVRVHDEHVAIGRHRDRARARRCGERGRREHRGAGREREDRRSRREVNRGLVGATLEEPSSAITARGWQTGSSARYMAELRCLGARPSRAAVFAFRVLPRAAPPSGLEPRPG